MKFLTIPKLFRVCNPGVFHIVKRSAVVATGFLPRLLYLLFFGLTGFALWAQDMPAQPNRQRVAVVLSGGGAKGVAHVGVLQALEEFGIPIDYIAGTSMGAIVGGMYAAGYSPAEIEQLITSPEFADASMGRIDKIYDYYYFHPDPDPAWLRLSFRGDQSLNYQKVIRENIPTNVVSPGAMDFMFMQYLGPASAVARNNFDSLFVPFRCIAADITNRRELVLRGGSLADAVRGSMTFPLYFKPIMIDNMVVFDGGMYNNFPADVVLEDFRPDIIIGSVVATNPAPPDVNDIFSQLENMLMASSNYYLPEEFGILLQPEVPDLAVTDFSRNHEVIAAGYNEVVRNMHQIEDLVQDHRFRQEVQYNRWAFRQQFPENKIGRVNIVAADDKAAKYASLFLIPEGAPVSFDQFHQNYFRLLTVGKYRHLYPRMRYNEQEGFYEIDLEAVKSNPLRRDFGGNLSSRSINQFFGSFSWERLGEVPLTLFSNVYLGNYYNSFKVGGRLDFLSKVPFYAVAETTFSRWNYTTESVYFFEEQKPAYVIQSETLHDMRIVLPVGYKARTEVGGFISTNRDRFYNTTLFTRLDTTDMSELKPRGMYAKLEHSTRDFIQYPTTGSFFSLGARYLGAREEYNPGSTAFFKNTTTGQHAWWEAELWWENFFLEESRLRLAFVTNLFYSNRPLLNNYTASRVMARQYSPFPLAGTRYLDSYRANHYAACGLKVLYKLNRNAHLQLEAHGFQAFRQISQGTHFSAFYRHTAIRPAWMGNAAFVYHTAAGPFSINASWYHRESEPWSFILNFGYILFNRRTF
ncbi:MAG: patatin-like phospholipase family protein [Bacteroidales bacterium]